MIVQPYLFFNGRGEEAMAFYKSALGAEVTALMRYSDSPEPHPPGMIPPGSEHNIMHAEMRIGDSVVMLSDGQCSGRTEFAGFALPVTVADDAEAQRRFATLAEGGVVQMPLAKTFFASSFGMLADRFGVPWMIITGP
jgi:PhnB protein